MINTVSLVKRLKPLDPEKIILFGSAVRGGIKPESDIDLLIIKKTKKRPVDRVAEALSLVWGNIPHAAGLFMKKKTDFSVDSVVWLDFALYDLKAARWDLKGKIYTSSCYACQQAAEKGLRQ